MLETTRILLQASQNFGKWTLTVFQTGRDGHTAATVAVARAPARTPHRGSDVCGTPTLGVPPAAAASRAPSPRVLKRDRSAPSTYSFE